MSDPLRREQLAKISLMIVFFTLLAFFSWYLAKAGAGALEHFAPMDLVLLALATLRLGRLVAYDLITEPLRRPFARTVEDATGAGESVEPQGEGARHAIGQMITCPICAGTWIAAILVYGLVVIPGPTRLFLYMTAAVGAAELLGATVEFLYWTSQAGRTYSGEIMLRRSGKTSQVPGPHHPGQRPIPTGHEKTPANKL